MATVKVKICGITNVRDARTAIKAGADFLGLNFYSGSPRYVTPRAARRIVKAGPRGTRWIGVFVNEKPPRVLEIARAVGLHEVQLHGEESPDAVAELRRELPVIKALRIRGAVGAATLKRFARTDALLLDGFDKNVRGGAGKTFDWKIARRVGSKRRIFVAGGLNAENVPEAIRVARPYAVDICSGVESTSPRKKDAKKIAALMAAVRAASAPKKRSKEK
ncbi:MAG: phosphoribosylanthranilate isomerase [Candidatus Acidiferrales bacterium]|jgi:phosphoribosylanthranilate isomerase